MTTEKISAINAMNEAIGTLDSQIKNINFKNTPENIIHDVEKAWMDYDNFLKIDITEFPDSDYIDKAVKRFELTNTEIQDIIDDLEDGLASGNDVQKHISKFINDEKKHLMTQEKEEILLAADSNNENSNKPKAASLKIS